MDYLQAANPSGAKYNGGAGALPISPPKAPRFANEVGDRLGMLIQRLGANNERLEMALERSFGATPTQASDTAQVAPSNHVNAIASQLSSIDRMLTEQQAKISKLEELL
jgi:hypothetical protein